MTRSPAAITLWFTGLPCIGKSTTARQTEAVLAEKGVHTRILDSDDVAPLFRGLAKADARGRDIVARAIAMAARHLNQAGITCLCAATTPRREIRRTHRKMIPGYVEIWCKGGTQTARARDQRRLYDMADVGFIHGFTGVDETYEVPESADLILDMAALAPEACAKMVLRHLIQGRHADIFPSPMEHTILQEQP